MDGCLNKTSIRRFIYSRIDDDEINKTKSLDYFFVPYYTFYVILFSNAIYIPVYVCPALSKP